MSRGNDPEHFSSVHPVQDGKRVQVVKPYVHRDVPAESYVITRISVTARFCRVHHPMVLEAELCWEDFVGFLRIAGPCQQCVVGYTVSGIEGGFPDVVDGPWTDVAPSPS